MLSVLRKQYIALPYTVDSVISRMCQHWKTKGNSSLTSWEEHIRVFGDERPTLSDTIQRNQCNSRTESQRAVDLISQLGGSLFKIDILDTMLKEWNTKTWATVHDDAGCLQTSRGDLWLGCKRKSVQDERILKNDSKLGEKNGETLRLAHGACLNNKRY